MANDRIWIHCLSCGEKKLISKHYPGCELGDLYNPGSLLPWITEHLNHHPLIQKMHLSGNPGLVITTDIGTASGQIAEEVINLINESNTEDR